MTDSEGSGYLDAPALGREALPPPITAVRRLTPEFYGAQLSYVDSGGTGDPVVLLHSAVGNLDFWAYQFEPIVELGFRLIAYDRRGHGQTIVDEHGAGTAVDDLAALLGHLEIDRVHLVGTAQGGRVANEFVLTYPDRVLSLTLASSAAGISAAEFEEVGVTRVIPTGFDRLPASFRELGGSYRSVNTDALRLWEALEQSNPKPTSSSIPNRAGTTHIDRRALAGLRLPVLLITGDADPFAPPPSYRALARFYTSSTLAIFPECGHSAFWERPDLFNRVLGEFLSSARTAT